MSQDDFRKRLERLESNQNRGYARAQTGTRTGMYDFVEEERRKRSRFPIRGLLAAMLLCIAALWVLKAYLIADMGREAHEARVAELAEGEGRLAEISAILVAREPISDLIINTLFPAAAERSGYNDPIPEEGEETTEEGSEEEPKAQE